MPRRTLWLGLAAIALGALVPRVVHLGAHLPQLVSPDEPTVMDRALALLDGDTPREWDWPQGAMTVLAVAVGPVRVITPWLDGTPWLFGRVLFALVGVSVVVLTGLLGHALTGRRAVAWLAAGLVAVSYLGVRLSRSLQPDHLQLAFVLGSLLCAFRYDERRSWRWLVAAGGLAGMAGATKYLGVLVVGPAAVLAVLHRRPRDLLVLAGATVAGFVVLAWGALVAPGEFWDGLSGQFGHQAGGHLGYDGDTPGWWFHATRSLPGNWGWVVTVLGAVGTVLALVRGDRRLRLTAVLAVGLFVVVGLSRVQFPHYVLILLPLLAVLGAAAVPRHGLAVAAVVVSLVPTLADDVRLVRAAGAPDTREVVDATLAALRGPVWTERYASLPGRGTPIGDFGSRPDAVDCDCYAVLSSYMEERFRREPATYAAQVANYDRIREAGRVVLVVAPEPRLAYNWDVLPRWGLDDLPVLGAMRSVGPTITVLDLRRP